MVQILHYFAGRKKLNKYYLTPLYFKNLKQYRKKYNLKNKDSLKNISFLSFTRNEDLWRFGGFFYNIRYIKIKELKNFLLFYGANEVLLSDNFFLKNLVIFFSLFNKEAFLLFFMRYISVFELYFLFSTNKITYFHMFSFVQQFNYRLLGLIKIFFFKKLWLIFNKKFKYRGLGSKNNDYYLFLYNIKIFNDYFKVQKKKKFLCNIISRLTVTVDFFINNCSKMLINSLFSFIDYKVDFNNTLITIYNYYNYRELKQFKKENINYLKNFFFLNFKKYNIILYFFKKVFNNIDLKNLNLILVFFFEILNLMKLFFFKILRFFNYFFFKLKNNLYFFKKIFNFFLKKLYIFYSLKFNNFLNILYNFMNKINEKILYNNIKFFYFFIFFFNKIFLLFFNFLNFVTFFKLSILLNFFFSNIYYLYIYYFFLCNFSFFDIINNNNFFIQITLKNFIFKKNFFDFNNSLNINNLTSLYQKQSIISFSNINNFSFLTIYNRFLNKKIINNIFYRHITFFFKCYFYYLFRYIYINDVLDYFFKFNLDIFLTKRTKYYFFKYNNFKFFFNLKFIENFFFKLKMFLKYNISYPYYFIIYNAIGLHNYLYLPFKYRIASKIEDFFLLVNFQNFSEYFEEDVDNLIIDKDDLIDQDALFEDEEQQEEGLEYEFDNYEEDDYFALYFIEDLNSISYYITNLYNLKFGMSSFFLDDFSYYDNLMISLNFLKRKNKKKELTENILWYNYLEDFSKVIHFYSFVLNAMNKQIFGLNFIAKNMDLILDDSLFLEHYNSSLYYTDFFFFNFSNLKNLNFLLLETQYFDFNISYTTDSFKYFPYLLDLSWWWEVWFMNNYNLKDEEILENLISTNKYYNLLVDLINFYKNNRLFFLPNDITNYEDISFDIFFKKTIDFLLDRIFITNMKKNFFLYYKSKYGFEYILFNFFSYLTIFYIYYKRLENLLFFNYLNSMEFQEIQYNREESEEIAPLDVYSDDESIELTNLKDFKEYKSLVIETQQYRDIIVPKSTDARVLHIRQMLNDWYLKDKYLSLGKFESVTLQKKYLTNINDLYFFKKVNKKLYNFLNLSDNFLNNYKLSFNISTTELYLSEIYNNYINTHTIESELDETFNFYNDYNLKFFIPESYIQEEDVFKTFDQRLVPLNKDKIKKVNNYIINKMPYIQDTINYDYENIIQYNKLDKMFFLFEKFSIDDYRIGEDLNKYIERLNSLKINKPFDFIFFKDFNFFMPFLSFLKSSKNIANIFLKNNFYNDFFILFIFNILINKKLFIFKNIKIKNISFLYFKLYFKLFLFVQNKNNLITWLLLLHFILYKFILNLNLNIVNYSLFFIFFPNIYIFFLLKHLNFLDFDYNLLLKDKLNFIKLLIKILLCFDLKKQVEFFIKVFLDLKKFLFLFLKSCYSYKYLCIFFFKYYKIIKLGFFYNFYYLLFLFFFFFFKEFNIKKLDLYFFEKKLKPGFFFLNLFTLNINNSLRNYISTLLIYYTDENIFFSQLNDIEYLKWLLNYNFKENYNLNLDNIYEVKNKFKDCLNIYKKSVLYNLYFFKQFDIDLSFFNIFNDDNINKYQRFNYDTIFLLDTELIDNMDFNLEQDWENFEMEDIEDESDFLVTGEDAEINNEEIDEWEDQDTVDSDLEEKLSELDLDFEGEEFNYELDMSMFSKKIFDDYDSLRDKAVYNFKLTYPYNQRFSFFLEMFLNRNLEIMRNLLIRFLYLYRLLPKETVKLMKKQKKFKLKSKLNVKMPISTVIEKDLNKILETSNSFFETNKSLISKAYENEFYDIMDYFMEFDTDIGEFGYSYKNYDIDLGLPLSDINFNLKKKNKTLNNYNTLDYRLLQIQDIHILNFNILYNEKIKQRRFFFLLYEFNYLNTLSILNRKKINLINFYEYLNNYFKKIILYLYKGFFNKNYYYIGLPLNLNDKLFKYIYRKVFLYLIKNYYKLLSFKNCYNQKNKIKLILISKLKNNYNYFFDDFTDDFLIYFFDFFFNNNLVVYSFEDFFLRVKRIIIFFKIFNFKLTFLGTYFLDDFFSWFFFFYPNLTNKQYWFLILKIKNLIIKEEFFIFKNKYELYQIYFKYNINEALFYFNNNLLYNTLEKRLNSFSFIYKFYYFFKDYIIFFFLFIMFTFLLLDISGPDSTLFPNLYIQWHLMDPRVLEEQEWHGLLNPFKPNEDILLREFYGYFFDYWGIF